MKHFTSNTPFFFTLFGIVLYVFVIVLQGKVVSVEDLLVAFHRSYFVH